MGTIETDEQVRSALIEMELGALHRWGKGDPSGFLEISAPDVVYFDPTLEKRIDNHKELSAHYEAIRGMIAIEKHDLLNPKVQRVGDLAVLTFNYVSYGGNEAGMRWNCTEVYRKDPVGWRIIQTHWSHTKTM